MIPATMTTAFSYQPLSARSIRVIKLLPSRHRADALRCSIDHLDLENVATQPFEALSYVWGEPTRQWSLDCGGKELLVTKNCHEALVNLRPRFFSRTLWIDAICINQGSTDEAIEERNGQVAMMGEIYSKASRVLIWLGPPVDLLVPTLFRYLKSLHLFGEVEISHPRLAAILESLVWRHLDLNHGLLVKHKTSRLLESLVAILRHQWFERVWTLQEVAFGRKCIIMQGQHTLDWESLCLGYLAIPTRGLSRRSETERLLSRWKLYLQLRGPSLDCIPTSRFQGESQVQTELKVMAEIRNMKATIPHDRVYSVYALFQAMGVTLPSPDYNKNIAEVFEEAVVSYIRCRKTLGIITLTFPPEENSGFPSWVPDWLTPGSYTEPLIWKLAEFDAKPSATVPTVTQNTGHGKLALMGRFVGSITKQACCPLVGQPGLSKDAIYQEFVEACLDWRSLIDGLGEYPTGKDPKLIPAALLRSFHHKVLKSGLEPWYRWLVAGCGNVMPAMDDTVLNEIFRKRRPASKWRLYVLDTGYCGVAHQACCVGDVVSLLPSLNPLVLREWKDREYRIITPAYCEGAMNGEMTSQIGELEEIILV